MKHSRREFLKVGTAAAVYGSALLRSAKLFAQTLHVPLGLQLYTLREMLPKDFNGPLKQISALGYREVEAAGYYNHSAAEVKAAIDAAGLKLVSAHYSSADLHRQLDQILAFNHELGVGHIICSSPRMKDPSRAKAGGAHAPGNGLTLDDWRWNADEFNGLADKVTAAGMKFGYHNHFLEFRKVDGIVPYDELLKHTDPAKVTMEMDCGWVVVGGGNPIEYLTAFPKRISMLHVKDFKQLGNGGGEPKVTELGQGSIDYAPIFQAAARTGNIEHVFVEQEAFDVPPLESLKIDAGYMHKLGIG